VTFSGLIALEVKLNRLHSAERTLRNEKYSYAAAVNNYSFLQSYDSATGVKESMENCFSKMDDLEADLKGMEAAEQWRHETGRGCFGVPGLLFPGDSDVGMGSVVKPASSSSGRSADGDLEIGSADGEQRNERSSRAKKVFTHMSTTGISHFFRCCGTHARRARGNRETRPAAHIPTGTEGAQHVASAYHDELPYLFTPGLIGVMCLISLILVCLQVLYKSDVAFKTILELEAPAGAEGGVPDMVAADMTYPNSLVCLAGSYLTQHILHFNVDEDVARSQPVFTPFSGAPLAPLIMVPGPIPGSALNGVLADVDSVESYIDVCQIQRDGDYSFSLLLLGLDRTGEAKLHLYRHMSPRTGVAEAWYRSISLAKLGPGRESITAMSCEVGMTPSAAQEQLSMSGCRSEDCGSEDSQADADLVSLVSQVRVHLALQSTKIRTGFINVGPGPLVESRVLESSSASSSNLSLEFETTRELELTPYVSGYLAGIDHIEKLQVIDEHRFALLLHFGTDMPFKTYLEIDQRDTGALFPPVVLQNKEPFKVGSVVRNANSESPSKVCI